MPDAAGKVRKVRVYSQPAMLANLDQRTREARMMRETRAALTAHVGGKPSATQKVLIERAVMLTLRLAMLDAKTPTEGMSERDSRQYLAWNNSLVRLTKQIGITGCAEKPRTLAEHVASKAAA